MSRQISITVIMIFLFGSLVAAPHAHADLWYHIEKTATGAFDLTGLEILAVGAAGTLVAFNNDQSMHDAWVNHQRMSSDVSQIGNFYGQGYVEAGIALIQLIFDTNHGVPSTEGLVYSTAVADILKVGVARDRPDSTTATSFPSGHTQISFSSATTIGESYGWGISAPFYAMGVFTGLSRLADDAHWLSDVVAGATVGVMFGRAGFAHHLNISPMAINDGGQGFGLTATWNY